MKIVVTSTQLQFYKEYGWTKDRVAKLLISKYIRINEIGNYYIEDDVTQHAIFVPDIKNYTLINPSGYNINWYIRR